MPYALHVAGYCFWGLCLIVITAVSVFLQPIALVLGGLTFLLPWGLSLRLSCSQVRR